MYKNKTNVCEINFETCAATRKDYDGNAHFKVLTMHMFCCIQTGGIYIYIYIYIYITEAGPTPKSSAGALA